MQEQKSWPIKALMIGDSFNIKALKPHYLSNIHSENSQELFINFSDKRYLYVLSFGVAVFANFSVEELKFETEKLRALANHPIKEDVIEEDYEVRIVPGSKVNFEYANLTVPEHPQGLLRLVMYNMSQTVALDYYSIVSDKILDEIMVITQNLESKGRLSLNKKAMLQFIGKALNVKNRIAENLYIFDAPPLVWDAQFLDSLHREMILFFDLKMRFNEIEHTFKIIDDNLNVFKDLSHHRESNRLEWIIIILIAFEIIHTLFSAI